MLPRARMIAPVFVALGHAMVLENLPLRAMCVERASLPWVGVRLRVVNGDGVLERRLVHTPDALDEMQIRTVGMSGAIEPRAIVEADSVDEERIPLPRCDRMAHPLRAL